jgi:Xaa-Pro aminopeptidase
VSLGADEAIEEDVADVAPSAEALARWSQGDRDARPLRLARLRERLEHEGIDAYYGLGRENSRYLTGFVLADGEEKVAGNSGQFLVGADDVVVFADSRYTEQAEAECPDARVEPVYGDLVGRWPDLVASVANRSGAPSDGKRHRIGVEAGFLSHAGWQRLAGAAPEIELVPIEGWVEAHRSVKEPSEIERIAAACAVADAALERLLPEVQPGATEAELALLLEWELRTGGAEAVAFPPTCLGGARAAMPHGSPVDRPLEGGEVVLFDFGAQVAGYRSDMTRTLFVGTPSPDDLAVYELVARAQAAALDALEEAAAAGDVPMNRAIDAKARSMIEQAGHGDHFGHGLGHGIGLATHEAPSLSQRAPEGLLPVPTVFSVEPGVYLPGQVGVRIEDLVAFDPGAGRVERLTRFPREVVILE